MDRTDPANSGQATTLLEYGAPGAARPAASGFRWVILGLLFLATTINYLDRLVMGIIAPNLRAQYHLSDAAYGNINAAFAICYALGQMGAGAYLEAIGTRIGYAVALAGWSVALILHAVMRTALGFGFARGLLGVTESPNYPAAVKTIAEWFPRRERAYAMGYVNAGCVVGAIAAPLAVPWLALHWGWQSAFIGTGTIGLSWVLLWLPIYRRPQEHPAVSRSELDLILSDPPEATTPVPWRTLLLYRQTWAFAMGKFLSDPVWNFYMFWIPDFLNKRHQQTLGTIGLPLVVIYLMASIGSVGGGWISSMLIKRGWTVNGARKIAMLICVIGVLPVAFTSRVSHLWTAVALLGLATAAHQGWSSNLYTLTSDTFPKRTVASVAGLGGTLGYLGATIFSSVTGYILYFTHGSYAIIFPILAGCYVVALVLVQLLAPNLDPVKIEDRRDFAPILNPKP